MSLRSWKREFYPTPAGNNTKTDLQAAKHCLRKWRGLIKVNLAKHKVCIAENNEWLRSLRTPDTVFAAVGINTCALCARHASDGCPGCPLADGNGWGCG